MHPIAQVISLAMWCAVPDPEPNTVNPELLRRLAALVGVNLSDDRAAALASQAEPHFALLRALTTVADPSTELGAEFRLDSWTRRGDD
jgi:hypothetical protein